MAALSFRLGRMFRGNLIADRTGELDGADDQRDVYV
jgi:hypothetical protein